MNDRGMVDFGLLCRCLPVRTAELCGGCNARCARFARSADGLTAHTQYRLQSVKAGTQAFGKTAVQTGAELRSSGWFAAENPVLILVFIWCLHRQSSFSLTHNKVLKQLHIQRYSGILKAIQLHIATTNTHWQCGGQEFDPLRLHQIKPLVSLK